MSETKELLEATVKGLQDKVNQLNTDLENKQQELEDVNKPVLSHDNYAELEDVVDNVISTYEFECGNFDYEFNVCYDNKIELDNLTFNDYDNLTEALMRAIEKRFKVEEENA